MRKVILYCLATSLLFVINSCKKDEGTSTTGGSDSPITIVGKTLTGSGYYFDYEAETNSKGKDFRDVDVSITDVSMLGEDSFSGGTFWLELDLNSSNLAQGVLNTEKFTYTKTKDIDGDNEREPGNIVYVGITTNIVYDSEGYIDEDLSNYLEATDNDEFTVDITNNGDGTHKIEIDGTIDGKAITGIYNGKVKYTN